MPRDYESDYDDMNFRSQRESAPMQQSRQYGGDPRMQQTGRMYGGDTRMQQTGRMQGDGRGQGERPRGDRGQGGYGRPVSSRKKRNETRSIIILAVEIVVFIILLVTFFILKSKLVGDDSSSKDAAIESTETAGESGEEGGSSGGVNVESDKFTLKCTKVQLANDAEGNPAALIYFTFVNKTSTPLSMDEVFPPSVKQNGVDCPTNATLVDPPIEVSNAQTQVADGASSECCYAISLQDFTSTLTLTIHDNYESFSDLGSTEIPLS